MNTQRTVRVVSLALLFAFALSGCKERMPAAWLEAAKKRADAVCACAKSSDPAACRQKAGTENPEPPLPDGYAVKYAKEDVDAVDATIKLSFECSQLAK